MRPDITKPVAPLCAALLLAACASAPPDSAGRIVAAPFEIEGDSYEAQWYLPDGDAAALVVLQPGFARRCSHLRETTRRLMAGGLMALCIDAPMAGGNPPLADALARRLARETVAVDGRALPRGIIVGGHSAGAAFAARLGAQLDTLAPERLRGALLLDPVATGAFGAQLRGIADGGRRPVLAILSEPHRCNALNNALPALRALRAGFAGVQLGTGSTHVDAEGEDSDRIATAACGHPQAAQTERLRSLAVRWARDIARGAQPPPEADLAPIE